MKNCPKCSKPLVLTFALRPENWPHNQLYRVCSSCTWEEKDADQPPAINVPSASNEYTQ